MSTKKRTAPNPRNRLQIKSPAQAMVEFGLALPVLLLVMYGLIGLFQLFKGALWI